MRHTQFQYKALDADGKTVRGSMSARDENEAFDQLAERDLSVFEIKKSQTRRVLTLTSERITKQDIAMLTREMNALIEASIPLSRGLLSIGENERNARLRGVVIDIASMIESGEKITAAFDRYRSVFGSVYIETLRSAEQTGRLGEVTGHLADMLERDVEMRQQIRRAMAYPMIVSAFVGVALSVIVLFVVPRFAKIFETNGVELPITTRVVRTIGDNAIEHWWIILGVLAAGVFALVRAWKSEEGRYRIEQLIHKLPYIGNMLTAATTARFTSVLRIGLESGIEVIEAVEVASMATGRPLLQREVAKMCREMRGGAAMGDVVNRSRVLPSFARRLLGSGKDSAELAHAGRILSRHYGKLSDHLAKNVNTIVEPMITVAMAGIVLLIALSVFLPMWQMISINK